MAKIMSYLRLGSSGKVLKKKKKDKDGKGKNSSVSNGYEEDEMILKSDSLKKQNDGEFLPPPPPPP
ncbi:Smu-2 suppressor of mec-8 and unc-52 protein, variant 2 [Salvia divinorum]